MPRGDESDSIVQILRVVNEKQATKETRWKIGLGEKSHKSNSATHASSFKILYNKTVDN